MTEPEFKVGEIAILVRSVTGMYPLGTELLITHPLDYRLEGHTMEIVLVYLAVGPDGVTCAPAHEQLARKPPAPFKREALGEWDLCPWQPRKAPVADLAVERYDIQLTSLSEEVRQ